MKKVLIIEDYVNIKNLYADAFSRANFEVETAHSGNEGLEKTKNQEFDVIILDVLMLELSGMEFLEAFDTTKHPQTTVVVVSNLDSPRVKEKAEALGAASYLVKSQYTPKELVETVQAILG